MVFALSLYVTSSYSVAAWAYGTYVPWMGKISTKIPVSSCVVYDEVAFGVVSNRFLSSRPSCPTVVDPFGMWMAWGYDITPPTAKFAAEWKGYFERAQFVVENSPSFYLIPWNEELRSWFRSHYHLIYGHTNIWIYANNTNP